MKQKIHAQVLSRASLAVVFSLAILSPIQLQSVENGSGNMMMEGKMKEHRHNHSVQDQRRQILAEMKAQDTELTAELVRIKSAPEEKKMELLIAVVNRMVEQRTTMHERMGEMMNQMMEDLPMDDGKVSTYSRPTDTNYMDVQWHTTNLDTEKF